MAFVFATVLLPHMNGEVLLTTIDHRGRDLIIIPNEEMLRLPTPELLQALFGVHLPADIRDTTTAGRACGFAKLQAGNGRALVEAGRRRLANGPTDL